MAVEREIYKEKIIYTKRNLMTISEINPQTQGDAMRFKRPAFFLFFNL